MGLMKQIDIQIRNGDLKIVSRCCHYEVDEYNRCEKCWDNTIKIVVLDDGSELEIGDSY